jgi:thiopeptide-type bacteriocin biosynthesis protein
MNGFLLRTPLLPAATFIDLSQGFSSAAPDTPEEFTFRVTAIRERVKSLVTAPDILEALFIASPVLVERLPVWLRDPLGKRGQKVERSLIKYLARMSTRPTPFGLFSGCTTGRMADDTVLALEPRARVRRHSRLDMDYLFALTEAINRDPRYRGELRFQPNDTLVQFGDRYRYVEPRVAEGTTRHYHLVGVDRTPYLDLILHESTSGASMDALVDRLVHYDGEISGDEAREYVHDLVDRHLLMSTLQPPVTGREPAGVIVEQLRALGASETAASLDAVLARLRCIDATPIGQSSAEYTPILETLKALPAPVEISRLVQVDISKPGTARLGPLARAEIERCANALAQCGQAFEGLATFQAAFERRYGTAAVPLLQALDEESGIGLGNPVPADESPLIAGLPLRGRAAPPETSWKPRDAWLLAKLQVLWAEGGSELVLSDSDMQGLYGTSSSTAPCSDAFSVGFTLAAASADAVDRGDFLLQFRGILGPSGARILGRFCHVDEEVAAIVEEHLQEEEEQDPEAVFAEIVHLPQGRVGNVIVRPVLRAYECTYLGRSGAPEAQQLPLDDLWVSVRGGRTVLWSKRLRKRVVPRLTTMHNFSQPGTLTPYRFLGLVQMQGLRSGFNWDWGPLASAGCLPRVRWGRCVLSRASWQVTADELSPFAPLRGYERFTAVRAWARSRRIPRLVELVDGDNELVVDLDNPLSLDAFVDLVADRPSARLSEMFPSPDDLCVTSSEGTFTHEIYIPIVRERAAAPASTQVFPWSLEVPDLGAVGRKRNIAPGADWMFVKIYAGAADIDRVLSAVVAPLVAEVLGAALADRWFFLRYADPDHHLRLRFRGHPRAIHGEVLPRLNQALEPHLVSGVVSRVQLDTYQPEVERYGGEVGVDLAERVFQADSDAVLALLCWLQAHGDAEARWQLALRGLDALMDDFELSPEQKRALVDRRRREHGAEFNVDVTPLRHLLGDRFRQSRKALQLLWDRGHVRTSPLAQGFAIWTRRSGQLKPLVESLRAAESQGLLSLPVATLLESYLHMYVNRIARAHGQMHELVMFEFLSRYRESVEARSAAALALADDQ